MKRYLYGIGLGLLVVAVVGCGGGGEDGGGLLRTRLRLQILWGQRSRVVPAPSSALSAVVTLVDADPDGGDFVWTINRDIDYPAQYTGDYESIDQVLVGTCDFAVDCFAEPDGGGARVGGGGAQVTINPDGTGIGTISTDTVVDSVEVEAGQTIEVGEHRDLVFTAFDVAGNIVAVTPGSALWEVISGGDKLRFDTDGHAEGLAPGVATVIAGVDGENSAQVEVTVIAPPSLSDFQAPTPDAETTGALDSVVANLQSPDMPPDVQALAGLSSTMTLPLQFTSQLNGYLALATRGQAQRSASRQNTWTWTVTEGGLTVTVQVTETSPSPLAYDWSITLDGTVDTTTFDNFPFVSGISRQDWLEGTPGWYQTFVFADPETQQPPYVVLVEGSVWAFDDGTSQGSLYFLGGGIVFTWEIQADGAEYVALWQRTETDDVMLVQALFRPDGTGWWEGFCPEDGLIAVLANFTDWGLHGSATVYETACTTPDPENNPVYW